MGSRGNKKETSMNKVDKEQLWMDEVQRWGFEAPQAEAAE